MRFGFWVILGFYIVLASCQHKKQEITFKQGPSFKEILSKDSLAFIEYFDSTTSIYSNFYYGFSVTVPFGWDSDRGFAEHTVFRLTNSDSGIVFNINVNKVLPDQGVPDSILDPYLKDSIKYIKGFTRGIQNNLNSEIYDLKIKRVYYVNREALKSTYSYLFRSDELEYSMYSEMFQFYYKGNIFTVGLNIPKEYYVNNISYQLLKNNFNLIPVTHE